VWRSSDSRHLWVFDRNLSERIAHIGPDKHVLFIDVVVSEMRLSPHAIGAPRSNTGEVLSCAYVFWLYLLSSVFRPL
jgi:hypothetical protein